VKSQCARIRNRLRAMAVLASGAREELTQRTFDSLMTVTFADLELRAKRRAATKKQEIDEGWAVLIAIASATATRGLLARRSTGVAWC
jgi:hypothetical protein